MQRVMALTRDRSPELLEALRIELFMNDLALKRATVRASTLRDLAARDRSSAPSTDEELALATRKICQLVDARDRRAAVRVLGWWGISEELFDAFVRQLVRARRAASQAREEARVGARAPVKGVHRLLRARRKPAGERRFCMPAAKAVRIAARLRKVVGITRVSIITGLADFGIPNAQAFRPDGDWSSTVGSGKSESVAGARVGAIMEEVEKWAQEQYPRAGETSDDLLASYYALARAGHRVVDPRTLDLPYDTCFEPSSPIGWRECDDLIGGRPVLVPSAALVKQRLAHDVFYSQRAGRKVFTTNGLASGMCIEEAVTHALCETVERHGNIFWTIVAGNPGSTRAPVRRVVDLDTVPSSTRKLLKRIRAASCDLRVFDIRADIRVPSFAAFLIEPFASDARLFGFDRRTSEGMASHPDPEVALNMAILEAVQGFMTHVAGAREDLTLRARSLGRHERSSTMSRDAFSHLRAVDVPLVGFDAIDGLASRDVREDVRWVVERVRDAGYPYVLFADLTVRELEPARVVRVIVPGLETINPFRTGLQARLALIADLLQRVADDR